MNADVRDRAVLPILIPVVAIILTEIIVFSMSRVLLATGKTPASLIALVSAVVILIGAAWIAARPRIKTNTIIGLLAILGLGSVAAGAVAARQKPFYEREAEANKPTIQVAAANLAFDTKTLELSPGGATIEFDNADTQAHNIAFFPDEDSLDQPLFRGTVIQGGQNTTYDVGPIDTGEYYFHCDVHPNMNGTAVVEAGAGGHAEEGGEVGGSGEEPGGMQDEGDTGTGPAGGADEGGVGDDAGQPGTPADDTDDDGGAGGPGDAAEQ